MVSILLYDRESWKITEKARKDLNATGSKMLSKITVREIADEARMPTVDNIIRSRVCDGTGLDTFFERTSDEWSAKCCAHASSQLQNRFLAT